MAKARRSSGSPKRNNGGNGGPQGLKHKVEELENILSTIAAPMFVVDRDLNIVRINGLADENGQGGGDKDKENDQPVERVG